MGPGNAYVAAAKRRVRGHVEIDNEAGPSEVVILADDTADAGFVAADLLAQAEHGSGDETVVLVTPSAALAEEVRRLVAEGASYRGQRAARPGARCARNAAVVFVRDLEEGVAAVNGLAPEHVEVMTRGADAIARRVVGGAVFVGPHAPVAVGDYGIGPNHVLPTGGSARFSSPLSVRDFQRRQSLVRHERARPAAGGGRDRARGPRRGLPRARPERAHEVCRMSDPLCTSSPRCAPPPPTRWPPAGPP